VGDEPALVRRHARLLAQPQFGGRERAVLAGEVDGEDGARDRGVRGDQAGPAPGEEAAGQHEDDRREVQRGDADGEPSGHTFSISTSRP
jgi:hypothetical protein